MKTLKFRVTATVTKIEEVKVDDEGMTSDEVEEKGREMAHEQFSVLNDGNACEKYNEDSVLITEVDEDEYQNPMCKVYTESEAIDDEDGNCSLCGGDCSKEK